MDSDERKAPVDMLNIVPMSASEVVRLYGSRIIGMKSSCGVIISGMTDHAAERIIERGMTLTILEDLIINAPIIYPDKEADRICQQKDEWKLVVSKNTGMIITVISR